jgi:shikimate dehydrogenase
VNCVTGNTRVYGLIGHPVRHSLSPAMYNTLFAEFGIDAVYLALDVHPDRADQVADAIRTLNLVGVNLTVPFKERLLPLLDRCTQAAREAGAVNVITAVDGTLTGYNTDGEGLIRSLQEDGGPPIAGCRAVVLGAGGAARAVASTLIDRGAGQVVMLNRTLSRAEAAAAALPGQVQPGTLDPAGFARAAQGAQLVVNCTSGPAEPLIAQLDPTVLSAGASWVDINYWMHSPPQTEACQQAGVRFHTGHGMLAHQGALAFELFTGIPVTGAQIRASWQASTQ